MVEITRSKVICVFFPTSGRRVPGFPNCHYCQAWQKNMRRNVVGELLEWTLPHVMI